MCNMGTIYSLWGRNEEALARYETAHSLYSKLVGPKCKEVGVCLLEMGSMLREQGALANAKEKIVASLAIFRAHDGERGYCSSSALCQLASIYMQQERFLEGFKLYKKARRYRMASVGTEHASICECTYLMATSKMELGDFERALQLFAQSELHYRRILGDEHVSVARARRGRARCEFTLGRKQHARSSLREVRRIFVELGDEYMKEVASCDAFLAMED
jgi:tetratricopeptide (TPR) repeat protein